MHWTITVSGQSQVLRSLDDLTLRSGDYLNVARAALSALEVDPATAAPFHLSATTEIPMQAGLAGSTAILACLTGCLLTHLGLRLNPYETAELVRKTEYDVLGIVLRLPGPLHDRLRRPELHGLSGQEQRRTPAAFHSLRRHRASSPPTSRICRSSLAHTGVKHHSGSVHTTPRERWLAGDRDVIDGYAEIARLARTAKRALLAADFETLASLMNRNPCYRPRPRRQRRRQRASHCRRSLRRRVGRKAGRSRRRRNHPRPVARPLSAPSPRSNPPGPRLSCFLPPRRG